jgi:hypothetical protein
VTNTSVPGNGEVREATDDELAGLRAISEAWLRQHANEIGVSYGTLMEAAEDWLTSWKEVSFDYTANGGSAGTYVNADYHTLPYDTPNVCYSQNKEFWHHYEIVKLEAVDERKKDNFFSCSC